MCWQYRYAWIRSCQLALPLLVIGLLTPLSWAYAEGPAKLVSKSGYVRVSDHFPRPGGKTKNKFRHTTSATARSPLPPAPLSNTFKLHSNPGASKVIYLDFDGHEVTWESEPYYYDPWNLEGPASSFSQTELTIIQLAWQSVAEDFLPFDIDVTTEFPGLDALKNTGAGDNHWGIRAVINHNAYDYSWAYQGSFIDSEDTELFAWSGSDPSVDETWIWIADSVSHEAGHALGLRHDGTTLGVEYYTGHGSGETSWSPIMGWTNYGLSQWDTGEYTNANNSQNDLRRITNRNGFGYRADDHGSSTSSATPVDITASLVAEGIIEETVDIDYFAFTVDVPGGHLISVLPDNLAPNLDILAKIYDARGDEILSSNPPTALAAELNVYLLPGDYYLSVDGTGYDDPESDGYSDYGSLGYYRIEARYSVNGDVGYYPIPASNPGTRLFMFLVLLLWGIISIRAKSQNCK